MSPADFPTTHRSPRHRQPAAHETSTGLRAGIEDEIGQLAITQRLRDWLYSDVGVTSTLRHTSRRQVPTRATNQDRPRQPRPPCVSGHELDSLCHDPPTARIGMRPVADLASFRVATETVQA